MAFLEDYTLLDEIGQGGYATVYKVRHNRLGYIRAIRVLKEVIANGENDETYLKFLDECRILLRLGNGNHPNIVHIYQPLLRAQRAIVEMDYVKGDDLLKYLQKKSMFVETEEVMKFIQDIGSALAYCHEDIYKYCMSIDDDNLKVDPADASKILLDPDKKKSLISKYRVIHNDIHSGNIIRREDGRYVILDFGLAIEGKDVIRSSRRRNGAPEFKAPEKWDNEATLSTESDVYSFGVVAYELMTGRVPFVFNKNNPNLIEEEYLLSKAHREKTPPPIFDLRKAAFENSHPDQTYKQDYPEWLNDVIMKCLAKDPKDRYRDCKELYAEIKDFLAKSQNDANRIISKLKTTLIQQEEKLKQLKQNLEEKEQEITKLEESSESNRAIGQKNAQTKELDENLRDKVKQISGKLEERPIESDSPGKRNNLVSKKWKSGFFSLMGLSILICLGLIFRNADSHGDETVQQPGDSLQQILAPGAVITPDEDLMAKFQQQEDSLKSLETKYANLSRQFEGLNNELQKKNSVSKESPTGSETSNSNSELKKENDDLKKDLNSLNKLVSDLKREVNLYRKENGVAPLK